MDHVSLEINRYHYQCSNLTKLLETILVDIVHKEYHTVDFISGNEIAWLKFM